MGFNSGFKGLNSRVGKGDKRYMIFRNVCIYLRVGMALTSQITSVFNTTVWKTSDAGRSGLAHAVQELVYSLKTSNIFFKC